MTTLLAANPLLSVFLVVALGYLWGRVRFFGFSLGVAAVLFAGLLLGAFLPKLEVSELLLELGLVLFVYTLGISSGPQFFSNLRVRGKKETLFVASVVTIALGATIVFGKLAGLTDRRAAGLFAGALTNTPALASVLEQLKQSGAAASDRLDPVIAYSVVYPGGVFGILLALWCAERFFLGKSDPPARPSQYGELRTTKLTVATIEVERPPTLALGEFARTLSHGVTFTRIGRGGVVFLAEPESVLEAGDLVTIVGEEHNVAALTTELGKPSSIHLEEDRRTIDYRRILVSDPRVTQVPLRALELREKHEAQITRVRRGDHDFQPNPETRLELGDRVRVVAPRGRMDGVARFFGDSIRKVSEVDLICFGLGVGIGLLVGALPIPIPGGATFRFGFAGGPLLAGLVLGRLGRTGPFVWSLPGSANLTLRQFGLALFLASVGLRAGQSFSRVLATENIFPLFLAGLGVSLVTSLSALLLGHYVFRIPTRVLVGTLSGIQTQPAALAFSSERLESDAPSHGYASVFPTATILKILVAQALLVVI